MTKNNIYNQIMKLDISSTSQIEYVWIGGHEEMRSKSKTLNIKLSKEVQLDDIPIWNYDGSSTEQATGKHSEVYLVPRKLYKDPFRPGNNYLVICDTWRSDFETPHPTNTRIASSKIFEKAVDTDPWFGFEMEFFMIDKNTGRPLGFPNVGTPKQGQFYCSVGSNNCYGREIIECHYRACLYAGINVSGINAEVACGQWEYQVFGKGIGAADDAWMTRYILSRICENYNVIASWDPKPISGDCNGSGMHTNYSTKAMREKGGLDEIIKAIGKLETKHTEHIAVYGEGNDKRLTGEHETASIDTFSWGYGDRGASIRVGYETKNNGKGYLEDRRPASSCDMYKVSSKIVETTVLS